MGVNEWLQGIGLGELCGAWEDYARAEAANDCEGMDGAMELARLYLRQLRSGSSPHEGEGVPAVVGAILGDVIRDLDEVRRLQEWAGVWEPRWALALLQHDLWARVPPQAYEDAGITPARIGHEVVRRQRALDWLLQGPGWRRRRRLAERLRAGIEGWLEERDGAYLVHLRERQVELPVVADAELHDQLAWGEAVVGLRYCRGSVTHRLLEAARDLAARLGAPRTWQAVLYAILTGQVPSIPLVERIATRGPVRDGWQELEWRLLLPGGRPARALADTILSHLAAALEAHLLLIGRLYLLEGERATASAPEGVAKVEKELSRCTLELAQAILEAAAEMVRCRAGERGRWIKVDRARGMATAIIEREMTGASRRRQWLRHHLGLAYQQYLWWERLVAASLAALRGQPIDGVSP